MTGTALINAVVPAALRSTVEHALATLPTSTIPFVAGLLGLLYSGTGVVFSVYQTLNHVAAVPHRRRAPFLSRYLRVFVMLAALLLGGLAVGALTVVATALPGQPAVQRAAAVAGSALVVFAMLLLSAKLLLVRPAPVRALWPAAVLGAAVVTLVLTAGAPLLARLVAKAGPADERVLACERGPGMLRLCLPSQRRSPRTSSISRCGPSSKHSSTSTVVSSMAAWMGSPRSRRAGR